MAKFIAIRSNFILGRYWAAGQICESDSLPSHHFAPCDAQGNIIEASESSRVSLKTNTKKRLTARVDVMAPEQTLNEGPTTLSQAQNMPRRKSGGMVAGLEKKVYDSKTLPKA